MINQYYLYQGDCFCSVASVKAVGFNHPEISPPTGQEKFIDLRKPWGLAKEDKIDVRIQNFMLQ